MKNDPAIQAVRDVRHRISAAVGHDPRKLAPIISDCKNAIAIEFYHRRNDRRTRQKPPTPLHKAQL
jgi:hypothetical protein